jgi:hypothetical protein
MSTTLLIIVRRGVRTHLALHDGHYQLVRGP